MLRSPRKPDNDWLRADRQERRKNVLVVVAMFIFATGAVALLIWGLATH